MLILFIVKTLSEYFIILVLLRNNKMLRLKELREQNGKLQREVASSLNRSKECISAWELGKTEPSIDDLKKLADYFNCSVDYLIGREDEFGVIKNSAASSGDQKDCELLRLFHRYDKTKKQKILEFLKAGIDL